MPVRRCRAFQNLLVNHLSQSETMSRGKPFLQYQWLKNRLATSLAFMFIRQGTRRISAPSQSVIVIILSWPCSSGSGLMKSMEMESPCLSGTGSGCSGPAGLVVRLLFLAHSGQAGM